MGLFGKIFGKQETKTEPKKEAVQEKPKAVIKEQRHILENIDAHMETIMKYAEKNDDYKLSKKALIEEGRDDEKIYEFEMWEEAQLNQQPDGTIEATIHGETIGTIKQGSHAKVNKLIKSGNIRNIHAEVSGGNYKILKYLSSRDEYVLDELENQFSITIEISYAEPL